MICEVWENRTQHNVWLEDVSVPVDGSILCLERGCAWFLSSFLVVPVRGKRALSAVLAARAAILDQLEREQNSRMAEWEMGL
jgi:hypothetical protein